MCLVLNPLSADEGFHLQNWDPLECGDAECQYPKIAVVLSGGNALGVTHVGVLRVLEEAGVPIDMIAGSSMGSLIGALYCAGYSPREIEDIALNLDWLNLFTAPDSIKTYLTKPILDQHNMLLSIDFDAWSFGKTLGLVNDQQIVARLSRLLFKVSHIRDFSQLSIPFSSVAVNLMTGEEVYIHTGNLAQAVRASLSFPGLFSPYPIDGNYYIDGGVRNYLPVSAALEMAADIVIAVSVELVPNDDISGYGNMMDVAIQAIAYMLNHNDTLQEQYSDMVIAPDMAGLTMLDFWKMRELIKRGTDIAETYADELSSLAEFIARYRPLEYRDPDRVGEYFTIPAVPVGGIVLQDTCTEPPAVGIDFPVDLFSSLISSPVTEDNLMDQLELLINQVMTSGDYESISYALAVPPSAGLTPGSPVNTIECAVGSETLMSLELNPLPILPGRGRSAIGVGYSVDGSLGGAAQPDVWRLKPGVYASLNNTGITPQGGYMHLGLSLQSGLLADWRLNLPLGAARDAGESTQRMGDIRMFLEPSAMFTTWQDPFEDGGEEKRNIFTDLSAGLQVGITDGRFLRAGLDAGISFSWFYTGLLGDETEQRFLSEFLLSPELSYIDCLPSRFVHEGIRSSFRVDFPVGDPDSWYRRIALRHEHFIALYDYGTLSFDIALGSYRGDFDTPWNQSLAGGWDGIPGYHQDSLVSRDIFLAGIGFRHRMPVVSRYLDVDAYLIGQFRAGNGYMAFPEWNEVSLRYGGGLGIGLDSFIGEIVIGTGMTYEGDVSWYLLVN